MSYGAPIGQAWFNALYDIYPEEAEKLRNTLYDPYCRYAKADVIAALHFLLSL